ncbi:MAG: glycosyltransferase family 2 protein [Candidatus Altiarchaeota archaeon]
MRTLIVMPAYNESLVLAETLKGLQACTEATILVVDDGSSDRTSKIAARCHVRVVRHMINLGLGAAIGTGVEVARREGFNRLVTFDADGQHNPEDVKKLLKALDSSDVAVGVREVHTDRMPLVKKIGNYALNILTLALFGVYSRDSQSGLRAFNRKAIESMKLRASRYEVSSEILYEAKRSGLRLSEVPVEVIYTKHSKSRGTGVLDGFKIVWHMVLHRGM